MAASILCECSLSALPACITFPHCLPAYTSRSPHHTSAFSTRMRQRVLYEGLCMPLTCGGGGTINRAQETRGLAIQMQRTTIAINRLALVISPRSFKGFPLPTLIKCHHCLSRHHSIFLHNPTARKQEQLQEQSHKNHIRVQKQCRVRRKWVSNVVCQCMSALRAS